MNNNINKDMCDKNNYYNDVNYCFFDDVAYDKDSSFESLFIGKRCKKDYLKKKSDTNNGELNDFDDTYYDRKESNIEFKNFDKFNVVS